MTLPSRTAAASRRVSCAIQPRLRWSASAIVGTSSDFSVATAMPTLTCWCRWNVSSAKLAFTSGCSRNASAHALMTMSLTEGGRVPERSGARIASRISVTASMSTVIEMVNSGTVVLACVMRSAIRSCTRVGVTCSTRPSRSTGAAARGRGLDRRPRRGRRRGGYALAGRSRSASTDRRRARAPSAARPGTRSGARPFASATGAGSAVASGGRSLRADRRQLAAHRHGVALGRRAARAGRPRSPPARWWPCRSPPPRSAGRR